jgi:hypothetical protein
MMFQNVSYNCRSQTELQTHPTLLAAPDAATAIFVAIDDMIVYLYVVSSSLVDVSSDGIVVDCKSTQVAGIVIGQTVL